MIAPERISFDPESHSYTLDGQEVPSVTRVLDGEGLSGSPFWTEADRRRGTAVHLIANLIGKTTVVGNTAEEIVNNSLWDPASTAPVLVPYGYAVAQFYRDTGLKPVYIERPVASARFGVCGTLDGFGIMGNGDSLLWDFKSGQPQESAWVQTALYAMCLEETMGAPPKQRTVVWIKPDGSYKCYPPRPAGGQDLAVGQAAIVLYKWRKEKGMLG